jgi:hypothetical protein
MRLRSFEIVPLIVAGLINAALRAADGRHGGGRN